MSMQHPLLRAILVVAFGVVWRTLGHTCQERCGHQRKHDYEGSYGITPSSLGLRRGAAASAGHNEARSRRYGRTVRLITKHSAVSRARRTASTQLAALSRHEVVCGGSHEEGPGETARGLRWSTFSSRASALRREI